VTWWLRKWQDKKKELPQRSTKPARSRYATALRAGSQNNFLCSDCAFLWLIKKQ
jgi:hypothetical protein